MWLDGGAYGMRILETTNYQNRGGERKLVSCGEYRRTEYNAPFFLFTFVSPQAFEWNDLSLTGLDMFDMSLVLWNFDLILFFDSFIRENVFFIANTNTPYDGLLLQ